MRINHNIPALRTLNQLTHVNDKTAKTMERLSSGLRINRSSDDAAGMAIANKMDAQVRGLKQANRNAMDGISMIQTAEGALNETHAILQRMRELAVQASNGVYEEADLKKVQDEINELTSEINRIGNETEFNKKSLLKGEGAVDPATGAAAKQEVTLQVGANKDQTMKVELGDMRAEALGLVGTAGDPGFTATNTVVNGNNTTPNQAAVSVETQANAGAAIEKFDAAIEKVSEQRGKLGAFQNRLEHTVNNLSVSEENLTASMSRIQDADMAEEMSTFTQQNVLSQAATAILAQANQRPQQVLQLLQR